MREVGGLGGGRKLGLGGRGLWLMAGGCWPSLSSRYLALAYILMSPFTTKMHLPPFSRGQRSDMDCRAQQSLNWPTRTGQRPRTKKDRVHNETRPLTNVT